MGQSSKAEALKCPRCGSTNTKFCYYNNYNKTQPRHYCKACKRHWTEGGILRDVPIGGGRKNKRFKKSSTTSGINITDEEKSNSQNFDPLVISHKNICDNSGYHEEPKYDTIDKLSKGANYNYYEPFEKNIIPSSNIPTYYDYVEESTMTCISQPWQGPAGTSNVYMDNTNNNMANYYWKWNDVDASADDLNVPWDHHHTEFIKP